MYVIKMNEDKYETLSEYVERGLRYLGKAMQCIEDLRETSKEKEDPDEMYEKEKKHKSRYTNY